MILSGYDFSVSLSWSISLSVFVFVLNPVHRCRRAGSRKGVSFAMVDIFILLVIIDFLLLHVRHLVKICMNYRLYNLMRMESREREREISSNLDSLHSRKVPPIHYRESAEARIRNPDQVPIYPNKRDA